MGEDHHGLHEMLENIGADYSSLKDGGDNICYQLEHQDGIAVKRDEIRKLPDIYRQYYHVNSQRYRVI